MSNVNQLSYILRNNPDLNPTADNMLKLNGTAKYDVNIMGIGSEGTAVVNVPFEMGKLTNINGMPYIDYSSYGKDSRGYRTIQARVPVRVSRL